MKWTARIGAGIVVFLFGVGLWLWTVVQPPSVPAPLASNFSLEDVTLINPMRDRTPNASLTVANGVMTIGDEITETSLDEYGGMFVLPGFVDMHSHLPTESVLKLTQHYGLLQLAHGVTAIREAGDIDGSATPAGRKLLKSRAPFPNLISCGPFVSNGVEVWRNTLQYSNVSEAPAVAAQIAAEGHQCVKSYEGLTPELIAALVSAAAAHDLHVIGHVPVELTMEQARLPDVQHFFGAPLPSSLRGTSVLYRNGDWGGVDEARLDEIVAYVEESGTRNTPTLVILEGFLGLATFDAAAEASAKLMPSFFAHVVWNPETGLPVYRNVDAALFTSAQDALRKKQALVKRLSDAGAVLHLGTDVGQPFTTPGASLWREMRLFAEAGVDAELVLAYATNIAGASLGSDRGVVDDGAPADFLIFREDPTVSLDALETLEAIVIGGRLYAKADLDRAVQERLAHYESWPLKPMAYRAAQRTVDRAASNF